MVGTAVVVSSAGVSAGVGLWLLDVPLALTFGLLADFLTSSPPSARSWAGPCRRFWR